MSQQSNFTFEPPLKQEVDIVFEAPDDTPEGDLLTLALEKLRKDFPSFSAPKFELDGWGGWSSVTWSDPTELDTTEPDLGIPGDTPIPRLEEIARWRKPDGTQGEGTVRAFLKTYTPKNYDHLPAGQARMMDALAELLQDENKKTAPDHRRVDLVYCQREEAEFVRIHDSSNQFIRLQDCAVIGRRMDDARFIQNQRTRYETSLNPDSPRSKIVITRYWDEAPPQKAQRRARP